MNASTKSRKNDLHIWAHNCVRYILPAYHFIDEETEAPGIIQELWPKVIKLTGATNQFTKAAKQA